MKKTIKYIRISLILLCLLTIIPFTVVWFLLPNTQELNNLLEQKVSSAIFVDKHGVKLSSRSSSPFISIDEVSPEFIELIKFFEDRTFDDNIGIDVNGLFRAVAYQCGLYSVRSGGSTLTMQTWRIISGNKARDNSIKMFFRKLYEIVGSIKMTLLVPDIKKKILQYYLNNVYFGKDLGIYNASMYFFSKHPRDLTLSESIMLLSFLTGKSLEQRKMYKKYFAKLKSLYDEDIITFEEYEELLTGPDFRYGYKKRDGAATFSDKIIDQIFFKYPDYAANLLNGTTIVTNLDKHFNDLVTNVIYEYVHNLDSASSAAFVMLDPSGRIVLYSNIPGRFPGDFDVIHSSNCRPGSQFKLPGYTLFIEELLRDNNSSAEIRDYSLPVIYEDFHDNYTSSFAAFRTVIEKSFNAPAVYIVSEVIEPNDITAIACLLGEDHLYPGNRILLGPDGFSPLNLCRLYKTILVDEGKLKPHLYFDKILLGTEELYKEHPNSNSITVFDSSACLIMKNMLYGVAKHGTAKRLKDYPALNGKKLYVKTGTAPGTSNNHLGISGSILNYTFTLFVELNSKSKLHINSDSIVPLLGRLLTILVEDGFFVTEEFKIAQN